MLIFNISIQYKAVASKAMMWFQNTSMSLDITVGVEDLILVIS